MNSGHAPLQGYLLELWQHRNLICFLRAKKLVRGFGCFVSFYDIGTNDYIKMMNSDHVIKMQYFILSRTSLS